MRTTIDNVMMKQIRSLRQIASDVGNKKLVALCQRAAGAFSVVPTRGEYRALLACVAAIQKEEAFLDQTADFVSFFVGF